MYQHIYLYTATLSSPCCWCWFHRFITYICSLGFSNYIDLHRRYVKCWLTRLCLTSLDKGAHGEETWVHMLLWAPLVEPDMRRCTDRSPERFFWAAWRDNWLIGQLFRCERQIRAWIIQPPEWARSQSDHLGTSQGSGFVARQEVSHRCC